MGGSQVTVFFSGGIDSSALLHYYSHEGFTVVPVFIDYGQKARHNEEESARSIAEYYGYELVTLRTAQEIEFPSGEIIGRNAFLVFALIMYRRLRSGTVAIAIHSGTPYYDCTSEFFSHIKATLSGYSGGSLVLEAPFLKWTKPMILEYARNNEVPIDMTYSCENGARPPCGLCLSCRDRRELGVL